MIFIFVSIWTILISLSGFANCLDTDKCYLTDSKNTAEEKLLNRISPLFGQKFKTDYDESSYVVSICTSTTKKDANASVTQGKIQDPTIVLGRRNYTQLTGGAMWVKISYGGGDSYPNGSECLGKRRASIYIICAPEDNDDQPSLQLAGIDTCGYNFVLQSSVVCTHTQEELSGFSVFMIIVVVALAVYFIVGILYKRFVENAQQCHQLPHFSFWSKVGSMLADGCNYMCRCDTETQDSWNNITSNFDNADRDDALLGS